VAGISGFRKIVQGHMKFSKALLLHNPLAGNNDIQFLRLSFIAKVLKRSGLDVVVATTGSPGYASRFPDRDLLIIYGGDGTLHHLLPEVTEWGIPILMLPGGTANVLAQELNMPYFLFDDLRVIQKCRVRKMYLGSARGRLFHLMASAGIDGHIISNVPAKLKKYLGVISFGFTALAKGSEYHMNPFEIESDGFSGQVTMAVISNSSSYGKYFRIAPEASIFSPELDVCLFTSESHTRLGRLLCESITGSHLHNSDVIYYKTKELRLKGGHDLPIQADGELIASGSCEFSLSEKFLNIVCPA
jgi:diacylglycerol kinase (ATP)